MDEQCGRRPRDFGCRRPKEGLRPKGGGASIDGGRENEESTAASATPRGRNKQRRSGPGRRTLVPVVPTHSVSARSVPTSPAARTSKKRTLPGAKSAVPCGSRPARSARSSRLMTCSSRLMTCSSTCGAREGRVGGARGRGSGHGRTSSGLNRSSRSVAPSDPTCAQRSRSVSARWARPQREAYLVKSLEFTVLRIRVPDPHRVSDLSAEGAGEAGEAPAIRRPHSPSRRPRARPCAPRGGSARRSPQRGSRGPPPPPAPPHK